MLKSIIFGVNGQDGVYLSQLLKKNNIKVIGISRKNTQITGDVSDYSFVNKVINSYKPDYIFHLAANSTTQHNALFDNHRAISDGTINILESVRLHCPQARIFLSGSAMQFKNEGTPIDERTSFEANSPYSVARIHSIYAGRYYRSNFDLNVYTGFFFNHDSPLRSERHVNQKIIQVAKRISSGSKEKLKLGDLDVKKEFNFAGDIVEAIWILVNQEKVNEAVIGSGKAYSIRDWVEYCFKKLNLDYRNHLILKNNFISEYSILISKPSTIFSLGWKPKMNFFQLADLMI